MSIRTTAGATALACLMLCAEADAAPQAAELSPAGASSPWSERIEAGADYRGDFLADDPRFTAGDRQLAAKCAVLSSNDNDGFEVYVRRAPGNTTNNFVTLSLVVEIGSGTCTDFKAIRSSPFDPVAFGPGDNGRVRFYASGGDYLVRVYTLARQPEKDPFILRVRKLDPSVTARKFAAGPVDSPAPGANPGLAVGNAVEDARTAYLVMCGKGQERLSAATCAGMRRDLDAAVAAQAAAAREAEVMGVYRQLCTAGREKLSKDTCASMLDEAKRTLASAAPARSVAADPAPRPAKAPASGGGAAALRSTYDELCAPGARQVTAETCAALKADAAPARKVR